MKARGWVEVDWVLSRLNWEARQAKLRGCPLA